MLVREFDIKKDYDDIVKWYKAHDWEPMPSRMYGLQGYIAETDDAKVAASWVYRDKKCPICILEWTIGNPETNWQDRKEGINIVMEECLSWAKEDGAEIVLTMTKNKRLIEKLKENDFIESDNEMTHLIRRL